MTFNRSTGDVVVVAFVVVGTAVVVPNNKLPMKLNGLKGVVVVEVVLFEPVGGTVVAPPNRKLPIKFSCLSAEGRSTSAARPAAAWADRKNKRSSPMACMLPELDPECKFAPA